MKYLYLVDPAEIDLTSEKIRFIPPTYKITRIEIMLESIVPNEITSNDHFGRKRSNLIKNIAHRLNYLEFLNGILSCHYATSKFVNRSALCGGIPEMMGMTFCILTYSIFEGIGSYMFRCKASVEHNKTTHEAWSSTLSEFMAEKDFPNNKSLKRKRKRKYQAVFNHLRDLRDRIHLDKPLENNDYSNFYNQVFYRNAVRCLRILFKDYLNLNEANFVTIKL